MTGVYIDADYVASKSGFQILSFHIPLLLRGQSTLGEFPAISTKGDTFWDFLFPYCTTSLFWKGVYSVTEEFGPTSRKHAYIILTPLNPTFIW